VRLWVRSLIATALFVTGATQLSCDVNQYCLNCAHGDGGDGDGGDGDGNTGDGSNGDGGNCTVTGVEVCDGKDNDCNGLIDDAIADVGTPCTNQNGECAGGLKTCANGPTGWALSCTKKPSSETCDNKDNDCDGVTDNGHPGEGVTCGSCVNSPNAGTMCTQSSQCPGGSCATNQGECTPGLTVCSGGAIQCIGAVGPPESPEVTCDGKDNDCDNMIDENITVIGSCGIQTCVGSANAGATCTTSAQCPGGMCLPNVGTCMQGTLMCQGGTGVCVGAIGPTFEACDMMDNDCDGVVDDGYNLNTDPQNCGACGNVCMLDHANAGCSAVPAPTHCTIASCKAGYRNLNGTISDGCEFGPCFVSGVEVCDGTDNNCDGAVDNNLGTPPAICLAVGECAVPSPTVATCTGAGGWKCNYGPTVSTDVNGNIVPETLCDGLDNDCDGKIDEGQPNLGQACHDNGQGVCQRTGTYICNPADLNGAATCDLTSPIVTASAEQCDNLDNNCNGQVDEGGTTGSLIGQDWIDIGNGTQMMQYEASKPDADGSTSGNINAIVCSKQGALPWTNIKYPDAVAACTSIGARLCTEQEWQRTCQVIAPAPTYPIALAASGAVNQLVGAEDYFAKSPGTDTTVVPNVTHAWLENYTSGYSGIAMQASPDTGTSLSNANTLGMGPHLDFQFNVQQPLTYHVWVLINSPDGGGNRVAVTVDGGAITNNSRVTTATNNTWQWLQPINTFAPGTGLHTVSIYMMRDGVRVDAIFITDSATTPALPTKAGHWAYETNPNTYVTNTCNGADYSAANDNILPTGTLASCFANGPGANDAYDMSGNVKEWTRAQAPGQNPIRGGASNNTAEGISCTLNFTLADDAFYFPNVGFRCCR
jgi:hypothetical protein